MRWASDWTMGRDNVPRGLDWISAESCSSLTFLLPSKAMRPITGFSITVTTRRPPALHPPFPPGTDLRRIQAPAGTRLEIRADGLDFDPPVALDLDRRHGLGDGRRRHKRGRQRGGDRRGEH